MSDKLLTLLTEFRFWRASIPVGLTIAAAVSLTILKNFPGWANPSKIFSPTANSVFAAIPAGATWLVIVVGCLLVGGWWCSLAHFCVTAVQRLLLHAVPLDTDPRLWSKWQRLASPLPQSDLRFAQTHMEDLTEYRDLQDGDQHAAYQLFMSDVLREPHALLSSEGNTPSDGLRALADSRLAAGLLVWIPWTLWSLAWHILPPYVEIAKSLQWASVVAAISLGIATWSLAKRSAGLMARLGATAPRLAAHARLAVNSGRTREEMQAANDSIL